MHIFQLLIEAGSTQATYPQGVKIAAVCMVDSQDTEQACGKASDRLFELGWHSIEFQQTVLLPPGADIGKFDAVMTQSYRDAQRLGVSVIEFPERKRAT